MWGGGILILLIGTYLAGYFYYFRVCGDYSYSKLTDILDPKYKLNPPNLSIIIYSTGVVLCSYYLFENLKNNKLVYRIMNFIEIIGRHSLDIFVWHMAIQYILKGIDLKIFEIRIVKILVYYFMMVMLPIYIRDLWEYSKRKIKGLLRLT